MKLCVSLLLLASLAASAQTYTRGIGVYPGDPKQYDGPWLKADAGTYRNLALHRPAYQSSAYDYNLTAQLVTDGIRDTELPRWVVTKTSDRGVLPKTEREMFLDGSPVSAVSVAGSNPWVEVDMEGSAPPEIDHLDVWLRKIYAAPPQGGWTIVVTGSDDGAAWKEVGRYTGVEFPGQKDSEPSFVEPVRFARAERFRDYRVVFSAFGVPKWEVADIEFSDGGREVHVSGPQVFTSGWMPAGTDDWVSVDLGAECTFDRVVLKWIQRAEGELQVSDDGKQWRTVETLGGGSSREDDVQLAHAARGRWVRVHVSDKKERAILSELEVWGRGGPAVVPQAAPEAVADGTLALTRGNWRLERASLVKGDGEQLSQPGFADKDWMTATVPGTVLTSYLNDGAIADPNFADNQYAISDAFFCADFWYRDEFVAPAAGAGRHTWLNFDGINWKAEVYLNGHYVGRIDGGFMRGRFDVTGLVHGGAQNALAVLVRSDDHPGATKDKADPSPNGGVLGRDNPTYHAAIGWDWMPTIRGRDTGIWSNVALTQTGAVEIENPLVTSTLPLPDTSTADVTIAATVRNLETHAVEGTLRAKFGAITVESQVTLDASSSKTITFAPAGYAALRIAHPKLWWPNGYGDANLYPVELTFSAKGAISDRKSFEAGIRQFSYSEDGDALKIWINGRRLIAKGGNWGFPESMLRYRAREYDIAMRYHRDQHFNMVRDWVGQTGDEAFYDAADRYGIVVWQDFWLANPWDGPNPDDNDLFLKDARDYLLRIRNHASLGVWCGRNEGYPPKPIDDGLRAMVGELAPGSHYISSSADGPVEGHGPYRVEPLRFYFEHTPPKLHSEIGSPNVPEMEIMRRTLSEEGMWPIGAQWHLHDFGDVHAKNPLVEEVEEDFGGANSGDEFVRLAQFVDYNAYRGMFEGQSKNRPGLLIWMSHPAWPSLLWQTYDYFFDTDAAYFAAKHACEPLHIQWNAATDTVEVVNYSAGDQAGLTARAEVLDIDGKVKWEKTATLDSKEDSTDSVLAMEYPAGLARTHFIRLTLLRGERVLSRNFYLHGKTEEDYTGIRGLRDAFVKRQVHTVRQGAKWHISVDLQNDSAVPALMVRAKVAGEKTGNPILPALYDDNYIALMPGERRSIHIEVEDEDTGGERPRVIVEGYNVAPAPQ